MFRSLSIHLRDFVGICHEPRHRHAEPGELYILTRSWHQKSPTVAIRKLKQCWFWVFFRSMIAICFMVLPSLSNHSRTKWAGIWGFSHMWGRCFRPGKERRIGTQKSPLYLPSTACAPPSWMPRESGLEIVQRRTSTASSCWRRAVGEYVWKLCLTH